MFKQILLMIQMIFTQLKALVWSPHTEARKNLLVSLYILVKIFFHHSLLKIENEELIENFLMDNKHFRLLNKKNITIDDSGDGFFCAVLQKKN